jgi:RIO-like serine/threonine protein kinase
VLASTAGGAVCVLKFFFSKAKEDDTQTKAERELKLWDCIYPEYKEHVRIVKLDDRPVLMMPHFASPNRTSNVVLEGVRKALRESFDARGLVHADVKWRNIGLRQNGQPLLYDLGFIEKKGHSSAQGLD